MVWEYTKKIFCHSLLAGTAASVPTQYLASEYKAQVTAPMATDLDGADPVVTGSYRFGTSAPAAAGTSLGIGYALFCRTPKSGEPPPPPPPPPPPVEEVPATPSVPVPAKETVSTATVVAATAIILCGLALCALDGPLPVGDVFGVSMIGRAALMLA